jgi:hypothetical protein
VKSIRYWMLFLRHLRGMQHKCAGLHHTLFFIHSTLSFDESMIDWRMMRTTLR